MNSAPQLIQAAEKCENMQDIRSQIDRIDRQVIDLLGQRFDYVKAAAKFKTDAASVAAPERFKSMLAQRRVWAQDSGLDPDVIEKMYYDLVTYFVAQEMQHLK